MGIEGSAALWSPAIMLLGFQLTLLAFRLSRDQRLGSEGKPVYLPLAEWLNLGSMLLTVFGVLVPSLLGLSNPRFAKYVFAMALALLGGYPLAVSSHYDLFAANPATTAPEKRAVKITVAVALGFLVLGLLKHYWVNAGE